MLNDAFTRLRNTLPWAKGDIQDDVPEDAAYSEPADELPEILPQAALASAAPLEDVMVDEHALIAAARAGNEDAFEELVAHHYPQVFGLAVRTMRDPDEAAEIAQDVFLAAWRGLPNFREEARLSTWLYRITYRRCLQSIEARQDRMGALGQMASLHLERLANAWSDMQANLAEQEWCQAIRDQIDALPVKYRMVLLMRHWQDLTYEEISLQMTLPISTVKTHLFRARQMLRERLQTVALPKVELPHVEMPDVGAALRGRWEEMLDNAEGLGELLRGHINLGAMSGPNGS